MSYKKLGDYIQQVNNRNRNLQVDTLLGVSITKKLIPSIANTVGTDMSTYKIIEKGQFAYGTITSRNGDKISIALADEYDKALVSQIYIVFEVIDKNELLPEYLMMWFSRPEFDRYARYHSHGSTRESFDWEDLCEVELPVPSIEKQREIVAQYQVVENKIKVNEQICEQLEVTAQTLYKQWFVDFEFPNEEGQPYKSSGGEMVFNEELEKEIPEGWEVKSLGEVTDKTSSGSTPSRDDMSYWTNGKIPWLKTGELNDKIVVNSEEKITTKALKETSVKLIPKDSLLIAMYGEGKTKGSVGYLKFEATTNQACCALISSNVQIINFLYYAMKANKDEILKNAIGGAQPNLSKKIVDEFRLLIPQKEILDKFDMNKYILFQESILKQNQKLTQLQSLLLSRLATLEGQNI
ncbi:restriction endonuclease subunit S [Sphingobacterium sp. HJSM2_6]|uniref:restriction endonuclease subunit S n=1 Tax=Sphingobacterium sp. HJSM2_6 TaxID=3366264 RepID=UPI003BC1F050